MKQRRINRTPTIAALAILLILAALSLVTNGVFADRGQRLSSSNSEGVALGEVDGDPDAFVANEGSQTNKARLSAGTGTFSDNTQSLGSSHLASAQDAIYVPSQNLEGIRSTVIDDGVYRFTITGGAWSPWPCDDTFPEPFCGSPGSVPCWGWKTAISGYIDRSPGWSSCPPADCPFESPAPSDFGVGDPCYWTGSQQAEAVGTGMFVDVALEANQEITLLAPDHKGFYDDNRGGVYLSVILLEPPVASFIYSPENPVVDEEITFDASSSHDPDGETVSYDWDFGDGNSAEGEVVTHAFTEAGEYAVTLTVTDNDGLIDSTELIVEVRPIPVLLVHGWRGSPETWSTLRQRLDLEQIDYYIFDYSPATGDPREYAVGLKGWIENLRANTDYTGKFDIVCHSMGALVSRWYMEELGGAENIRQWIGVAPVNHGAAIADIEWLVPDWLGWFFPDLIGTEEAVKQMKTNSPTVTELNKHGIEPGVVYRVIVGINSNHESSFGGPFNGKTLVKKVDDEGNPYYYYTYQGDGVVAMEQSKLEGAGIDCFDSFHHNSILHSDNMVDRVIEYLQDPSEPSFNNCPTEDPEDDHYVTGTGNRGILSRGEYQSIESPVDSSVNDATVVTTWPGSELDLTLTSPSGHVMEMGVYPVVEYWKGNNSVGYVIDLPEPGVWTARIDAVDVPEEGESYTFMTFYSSQLAVEVTTAEGRYAYHAGESVTVVASITEEDVPITGALVRAEVSQPDGSIHEFVLYDDGSHADALANDGNYTNAYSLSMLGYYDITIFAGGTTSEAFERMGFLSLSTTCYDFHPPAGVGVEDTMQVASRWRTSCEIPDPDNNSETPNYEARYDINGDCIINVVDIMLVVAQWGETCE